MSKADDCVNTRKETAVIEDLRFGWRQFRKNPGFAAVAVVTLGLGIASSAAMFSLVLSLSVGSRTKEIAVRKAIGAQERQVLRLMLSEGGRLILVGVALGALVAVIAGRALEGMLFEVRSADPISLGGAAVMFGTVALFVCVIPALRVRDLDVVGQSGRPHAARALSSSGIIAGNETIRTI